MKYLFIFAFAVFLLSCGKKNDDEPTCKENKYNSECKRFREAELTNRVLPQYEGCLAAYKYGADGKGSGKLSVMPRYENGLSDTDKIKQDIIVRLISDGKIEKEVVTGLLNIQSPSHLIHFDIEEGKDYTVTCDEIYQYKMDFNQDIYSITGKNSIRAKLISGVDSPNKYFGCVLDKQDKAVELSFVPNENVEKIIVKRNGEMLKEVTEANASSFSDATFREVGKEYKYTCDAVIAGKLQLGAFSVTVKKDK